MDAYQTKFNKERDFFNISAPAAIMGEPASVPIQIIAGRALVLDLERRGSPARTLFVDGETTPIIGFPAGTQSLIKVATNAAVASARSRDRVDLLLPRRTFDKVADDMGVPRLSRLNVEAGVATGDVMMRNLGACLDHAFRSASPSPTIDRIAAALNLHIAQRYGGLLPPRQPDAGGLAPWQLRLARSAIDDNLDGSISLKDLAQKCGLSTSHFSRAFAKSTGLAPHRWLSRRRIDIAKDLMAANSMPLAQVAVACGFSDQSHFTRTFAALTGVTPGRWRDAPEQRIARVGQIDALEKANSAARFELL